MGRILKLSLPATPSQPFAAIVTLLCIVLLASCSRVPDGVVPVPGFEVSRYLGTWYEILRLDHRFERGLSHVTATYALNEDGTLSVINRGLDVEECEWNSVEGYAEFLDNPQIGSLAVTRPQEG